jgi:hypothetical protein
LTDAPTTPPLWAEGEELYRQQRAEAAEAVFRRVLARHPDSRPTRAYLGAALMMQGRYADGWRLMDNRSARTQYLDDMWYPEWQGEGLAGRSIFVWGEQGLGDEIMLARFAPMLRGCGAGRITLACQPACVRAFEQLGLDQVISRKGAVKGPAPDRWAMLMSLPGRLGIEPANIPGAPYLTAAGPRRGRIGVAWQGQAAHPLDAHRSISSAELLLGLPGAQALVAEGDVQASLEQVAGYDLIVTVDTAWAHMAGALGKPVWVLLPAYGLDWRWGRGTAATPWYPTARLFRQTTPGDWDGVVAEVRAALARGEGP